MPRSHKRRPESLLQPIRAKIAQLFDEADALFTKGQKEIAKRRVKAARRLAMKVQLRIPQYKDHFCRDCNNYQKIGQNVTIRIRDGIRIKTCKECGKIRRRRVK